MLNQTSIQVIKTLITYIPLCYGAKKFLSIHRVIVLNKYKILNYSLDRMFCLIRAAHVFVLFCDLPNRVRLLLSSGLRFPGDGSSQTASPHQLPYYVNNFSHQLLESSEAEGISVKFEHLLWFLVQVVNDVDTPEHLVPWFSTYGSTH